MDHNLIHIFDQLNFKKIQLVTNQSIAGKELFNYLKLYKSLLMVLENHK
jgi:hypothetical protein